MKAVLAFYLLAAVQGANIDGRIIRRGEEHARWEAPSLAEVRRQREAAGEVGDELCREDAKAPADPTQACPENCPFSAELSDPTKFCHFKCVKAEDCGMIGTMHNQTIPEKKKVPENPYCRSCDVKACDECVTNKPGEHSETVEKCKKCMLGYTLTDDGQACISQGDNIFLVAAALGAIPALLGAIWYVLLFAKPVVNPEGEKYARQSQLRIMVTQDHQGDEGQPYPFFTNLLSVPVAGPGATALFRFQAAIITWAILVISLWLAFVAYTWGPDPTEASDLLILGIRPAVTPRQLCEVVFWGRQRQMELIWTKVYWLAYAYLLGTLGALGYGIYMAKFFRSFDSERATLSDYVAVLENVPTLKGSEKVEDILKEAVGTAVGSEIAKDIVAVSVGWNFSAHREQVQYFIDEEATSFHQQNGEPLTVEGPQMGGFTGRISKLVLQKWNIDPDTSGQKFAVEDLKKRLQDMETAPSSYVIFMTETARSKALKATEEKGVNVKGTTCTLRAETYEPKALFWHNLHVTPSGQFRKFIVASANIFIACMAWTVLLYLPYAHYMSTFSYANGDVPSTLAESVFVILVAGAQAGLFVASAMGADSCQYHYEDQKHRTYIIYYTSALILNLVMDLALQAYLSYLQMVGVGARVADGRMLGSLTSFQEVFESYPMQKSVGKLLFKYCWPSTFLIPFMVEPFIAQLGPHHVGTLLLRSNKRLRGASAERALELSEMEQGRYADVLFNLLLVTCIPFISPAYMLWTYGTFVVSHMYIYAFDHWKTLRWAKKFYFASDEVHWFGEQLLSLPLGVLAAALVFKANQMSGIDDLGSGVLQDRALVAAVAGAFVFHVLAHLTMLEVVVKPLRTDPNKVENKTPFSKVAKEEAATHLSTNPIQCLRSKFILEDSPPLSPFVLGKERIMKANPKLGAFFDGEQHSAQKEEKTKLPPGKTVDAQDTQTSKLPPARRSSIKMPKKP